MGKLKKIVAKILNNVHEIFTAIKNGHKAFSCRSDYLMSILALFYKRLNFFMTEVPII